MQYLLASDTPFFFSLFIGEKCNVGVNFSISREYEAKKATYKFCRKTITYHQHCLTQRSSNKEVFAHNHFRLILKR